MKRFAYTKQPAIPCALGLAAGIIVSSRFGISPSIWGFGTVLSVAFMLWILAGPKPRKTGLIAACLLLFLVGGFRADVFLRWRPPDHVTRYCGESSGFFKGLIRKSPVLKKGRWRIPLHEMAMHTGKPQYSKLRGSVLAVIPGEALHSPEIGDTLFLEGRLEVPRAAGNPGDFDYRAYLRNRGIHALLRSDNIQHRRSTGSLVFRFLARAKRRMAMAIERSVGGNDVGTSSIAKTLLLGKQPEFPKDLYAQFRAAGLLHLLAISGFHTGILISVFWFILCLICPWRLARISCMLTVLWTYAFLVGMPVSVTRSAWMATFLLVGAHLERTRLPLNALAVSAILLLLWCPGMAFDAGFQLSFAATAGILLYLPLRRAMPRFENRLRFANGVLDLVWISVVASLFTAPVLIYHFGCLTPFGVLAGLPGSVLVGISLLAEICLLAVYPISQTVAHLYGGVAWAAIETLRRVAWAFAQLPYHTVELGRLGGWMEWTWYLVLLGFLHLDTRWGKRLVFWTLALAICVSGIVSNLPGNFALRVMDVGNGDAMLVDLPNGKRFLVDAGNCRWKSEKAYQSKILRPLRRMGVKRLDAAFISHFDADHYCGLISIVDSLSVGAVFGPARWTDAKMCVALRDRISERGIPYHPLKAGDRVGGFGRECVITVLGPLKEYGNRNDNSIVMMVQMSGMRLLFAGDAGRAAQQDLVRVVSRTDLLKAPHHGEVDPGTLEWAEELDPDVVLISNRRPARERPWDRWGGGRVYSTRMSGMLTVTIKEEKVVVREFVRPVEYRKGLLWESG